MAIGAQLRLHSVPRLSRDDCLVLGRVTYALVLNLAHVDRVGKDPVDVSPAERPTTERSTRCGNVSLGAQLQTEQAARF